METKFENKSKISMQEVLAIQNKQIKKSSLITSIIMFVIILGASIGLYFVNSYIGISLGVAGLLGAFIIYPYVIKKSASVQDDAAFEIKYNFFEDEFDSTIGNTTEKYAYSDIKKILVFEKYVYIFVGVNESLVMTKQGMTKGVIADLFEFLKNKKIKIIYKN